MAKTNQINVKVNDPTNRAIEEFAKDRDYTKAEAVRRITESRLRGEGYLSREIYGDGKPEPVADGSGTIRRSLNIVTGIGLSVGILAWILSFASVPTLLYIAYSITGLLMAIVSMLLNYTSIPESIDRIIYDLIPRGVHS